VQRSWRCEASSSTLLRRAGTHAYLRDNDRPRISSAPRRKRGALRRIRGTRPEICPTGKSVNYLSSPLCKNISVFAAPKSPLHPSPSRPHEGRIRIVRDAGWDAVDAAASGEQVNCRAGFGLSQTRERSNGALTNGAEADGKAVWSWHPLLMLSLRRCVGPTGLGQAISVDDGDKTNSSPGRARRKPLKPLRAGTPGDPGTRGD
jgi:hypothetical protein